jgi:dihydropyrimidinase
VKNGKIVNDDGIQEADICVESGIIKYVGKDDKCHIPNDCRIIDAAGKFVIPGGIDPHTHFELEYDGLTSVDDFYDGTK